MKKISLLFLCIAIFGVHNTLAIYQQSSTLSYKNASKKACLSDLRHPLTFSDNIVFTFVSSQQQPSIPFESVSELKNLVCNDMLLGDIEKKQYALKKVLSATLPTLKSRIQTDSFFKVKMFKGCEFTINLMTMEKNTQKIIGIVACGRAAHEAPEITLYQIGSTIKGKGLGSALIAILCNESLAQAYGYNRIVLESAASARGFYEKLGFLRPNEESSIKTDLADEFYTIYYKDIPHK